ncbi:uncharacterized protein ARMOST_11692 [Armillaria ostoyae]|uniref:Uncharacterized protein n=1 Tax=Armillaria ostoyae TaxID=47428 RepID=A0A284RHT7_ARMOS|nr:uncharacterized protein ARMOST_11692 [Armillaria ostoyae]
MQFGFKSFSEDEQSARALTGTRVSDKDIGKMLEIKSLAEHVPDCTNKRLSSAVYGNQILLADGKISGTSHKSLAEHNKHDVAFMDNAGHSKQDTFMDNANNSNEDVASGPDTINAKHCHQSDPCHKLQPTPIMATKIWLNSSFSIWFHQPTPPNYDNKIPTELQLKNSDHPVDSSTPLTLASASASDSSIIYTDGQCKLSISDQASPLGTSAADILSNREVQGSIKLSVNG